jgi:hypothetical protein
MVKPCRNCGEDHWSAEMLRLAGSNLEDDGPSGSMAALLVGALGQHKPVLTCLVLTCQNCFSMYLLNFGAIADHLKKKDATAEPAEQPASPE